jgi:Flp pilus assembly protein TadG
MIRQRKQRRKGIAAVEMAVVLPLLVLLLLITIDFSRIFYYTAVMRFCARDGALYACQNPTQAADSAGIQNAALLDDSLLPMGSSNVSSSTGTDANGNPTVTCTLTYTFTTITSFPGIPNSVSLSKSETVRVSQLVPN